VLDTVSSRNVVFYIVASKIAHPQTGYLSWRQSFAVRDNRSCKTYYGSPRRISAAHRFGLACGYSTRNVRDGRAPDRSPVPTPGGLGRCLAGFISAPCNRRCQVGAPLPEGHLNHLFINSRERAHIVRDNRCSCEQIDEPEQMERSALENLCATLGKFLRDFSRLRGSANVGKTHALLPNFHDLNRQA